MKFKLFFLSIMFSLQNCTAQNTPLYVGTYTDGESEGIYQLQFNMETGELSNKQLAIATENPSFISYSPDKKNIYAVGEGGAGSVSAFKVQENGTLEFLNSVPSNGAAPCHISINPSGNIAVVSNYNGGNLSLYEISNDGKLQEAYQIFNYNTLNKTSHAHSAQFYKDYLFVSDLGINAVYQYELNSNQKNYNLISSSIVEITEKAGPRHFSLSNDGQYLYIINEYASTITAARKVSNQFELIDNYSTLDDKYKEANACADIHLSQDERFLYGSNRGENTIVVFKRNTINGTLVKIQTIPTKGNWPRNFTLDPSGKFLLVANQKSHNITVFKVDPLSGTLKFLNSTELPSPVCLLF